ncbi:MAG: HAMP domain-containing protein [Tenericutes bacterium]|nr:HAMP domain-containing protein [Mycoplasmatota bacterium]
MAFIAGLILLNNSFLENYYVTNRKASLVEVFSDVKALDLESSSLSYDLQEIENVNNIDIQILEQIADFDENYIWTNFQEMPSVFERLYGNRFSIPEGVLGRIIYDFNSQSINDEASYATEVPNLSDGVYSAYLMDIQSDYNYSGEDTQVAALCVSRTIDGENDIYYVMTVTFQSIHDSIKIFNSFTIIVGFFFMVLSFIIMYFISYSFTNPILQINKIAQEIAKLNFSTRVTIKTDDEYEDLGNSINQMSSQLEENINELKLSNVKLAKEILHKTDVDKMRKEFIANASHELKTPLTLIMGYTEALKIPDIDGETKEEYLNIILDETNKMDNLVKELLNVSQLESGNKQFVYGEMNLHELISETKKLFNLIFEENGIVCELDSKEIIVNSDYNNLQTVLTNFINNAINHVDDLKSIKISVTEKENNYIRVSVFNTGPNIPEEDISHIWESFYKVDKARTRSYGGQGLGLSICRTILDIMSYDYGVINTENGIEFYFDIYNN